MAASSKIKIFRVKYGEIVINDIKIISRAFLIEVLKKIPKKIFDEHVSCIYVARLDSDLDNYSKPDYGKPSSERKDVETKRDIPKESILARVVYPNSISKQGIEDLGNIDAMGINVPLPWKKDEWERYRKDPDNALGTRG